MATKKSAQELKKEYQESIDKTKAIEIKIRRKLIFLCEKHPDLILSQRFGREGRKLSEFSTPERINVMAPTFVLTYIEAIEKMLEELNPYKQGVLEFPKD